MNREDYSKLSVDELVMLLTKQKEPVHLVENITHNEQLEIVGKLLNTNQILSILTEYPEKIYPILVGMSPDKFAELLLISSDNQLDRLKSIGFSEAMSHHLTLFINHLEEENLSVFKELSSIESAIHSLDPEIATMETIDTIRENFNTCFEKINRNLKMVKKGMVLVWGASDIELIDKLNKVNIALQRMKVPAEIDALVSQKLFSIYHGLQDEDSAVDGLANFSVWYLEDYAEVGLLPANSKLDKEALFRQARERLQKANLVTIKDLKEALIFSRQTLKDYLSRRI